MSISLTPVASQPASDTLTLRNAKRGQWLTVAHGMLEGTGALIAASTAGSIALLSFGLDSFIEVLSASIVLWRLSTLGRPHRFALSELAGLRLIGACFLILSADIAQDSYFGLRSHETPKASALGIAVSVLSIALMPLLARAKRVWAEEVGSATLKADARQTDFCAYLAGITLLGLALNATLHWWWVDAAAALIMVPIIAWEGVQALRGKACGCCKCSL
jgi:divalent metal cation (Fe/Co/Zn/Cd) transporter